MAHWASLIICIWAFATGPASETRAEEYNPFQVPKDAFFTTIDKIAFWPTTTPPGMADANSVRRLVEGMVIAALERRRYAVMSSEPIGRRWEELSGLVGGVFDPVSGESNSEMIAVLRGILTQEFAMEHGVDAFVSLNVTEGPVSIWSKRISSIEGGTNSAYVAWMGAHEQIRWDGDPVHSLWANRPNRATGYRIGIRVFDPTDIILYDVMVPIRWTRVYIGGSYNDRPESSLLNHEKRIRHVVSVLVKALNESKLGPEESERR